MAGTFKYRTTRPNKKDTKKTIPPPKGRPLLAYRQFQSDPEKNLIGSRFLCVEGALLLVGPSGIGKSSATIQLAILFSIGEPAFNLSPTRALKISIVQAEDDEGDIAEMVSGATNNFKLTSEQITSSEQNCIIYFHKDLTAEGFLEHVIKPILDSDQPDIIIINPLQAYLGADAKDVEKVSRFLRNGLNPLLEAYQCAAIIVHHTPKTNFRNTAEWRANDWMYAGSGTADITNFARGVIIIEPTEVDKVYKFIAAKRGNRTGWRKEELSFAEYFTWADGSIFWRDASAEERKKAQCKKQKAGVENVLAIVPETGLIEKEELIGRANLEIPMGEKKVRTCINVLVKEGRLFIHEKRRPKIKPEIFLSRFATNNEAP
jgi:hypothetical protein